MNRGFIIGVAVAFVVACSPRAEAAIFDLTADWSDLANPNGAWQYREGNNPLPLISSWNSNFAVTQPAYARQVWPVTEHIPAFFKATSDRNDWLVGDIIVHPTGTAMGGANGMANIIWTSDFDGIIGVSGYLWQARDTVGRSAAWDVYLNSQRLTGGTVAWDDIYSRALPCSFADGDGGALALDGLTVQVGDVIGFYFPMISASPDYIGISAQIIPFSGQPTPEPASMALLLLGSAFLVRRKVRTR